MNIRLFARAAAASLAMIAVPGWAQAIEEKNLVSGKVKIEPDSGYIYLAGTTRQIGVFLKVPSAEDIAAYAKEWEDSFKKAQDKYAKAFSRWEYDRKLALKDKTKIPDRPVEPKAETFSIGDLETRNSVSFGPEFVFSKDKAGGNYSYMMKAKPGTYVYYGPIYFDPRAGATGMCYCMGSVQFEVKAGAITDLGNFLTAAPDSSLQKTAPGKKIVASGAFISMKVDPNASTTGPVRFGLPDSLKSYPSAQADFRAAAKMDNFFGLTVSRLPPVPGVLGYQRDKVVDLKAQTVSAN